MSEKKTARYEDFSGGLNEATAAHLIRNEEVQVLENMELDEAGKLTTRKGSVAELVLDPSGETEVDDFDALWTGAELIETGQHEGTGYNAASAVCTDVLDALDSGWTCFPGFGHDTTCKQQGTASLKFNVDAAIVSGVPVSYLGAEKEVSLDLSGQLGADYFQLYITPCYWKPSESGSLVSAYLTVRLQTSAGNYFYTNVSLSLQQVSTEPASPSFSLQQIPFSSFLTVGSPSWDNITKLYTTITFVASGPGRIVIWNWQDSWHMNPRRLPIILYKDTTEDYSAISTVANLQLWYTNTPVSATGSWFKFRFKTDANNYYEYGPVYHPAGSTLSWQSLLAAKAAFTAHGVPDWAAITRLEIYEVYVFTGTPGPLSNGFDRAAWQEPADADVIRGIYEYVQQDGDAYKIEGHSSVVKNWSGTPTDILTGATANKEWYFATFKDLLIAANGVDVLKKWNGSGSMSNLTGSPPVAQYLKVHEDRLFISPLNSSRVYYSKLADPDAADSWDANAWFDTYTNDGQVNMGFASLGDPGHLYVFKTKSIFRCYVSGDPLTNWNFPRVANIGALAPRSIVEAEGGVFFLANDWTVRFWTGSEAKNLFISRDKPHNRRITEESFKARILDAYEDYISQAAACYRDGKYWLWFCTGAHGSENDMALVYDFRADAWSTAFGYRPNCFAEVGGKMMAGLSNAPTIISIDQPGVYNDAGAPIAAAVRTKDFNFGLPETKKRLRAIYTMTAANILGYSMDVTLYVDNVAQTPETLSLFSATDNDLAIRSAIGGRGRQFSFAYAHSGIGEPISLQGISALYRVGKPR